LQDGNMEKRKRGRPRSSTAESRNSTVLALDRGLTVLRALAREGGATLGDLALRVGMPPSTAHRILATLENHQFVEFDETLQIWTIGIGSYRIGSTYLLRTNLIDASRKTMQNLMKETGETANLAIADDGHIVFISQVETQNPIRAFHRPGTRSPMHASGIGKILLARMSRKDVEKLLLKSGLPEFTPNTLTSPEALFTDLDISARRGWAYDNEERYTGMRCIAAPIFNAFGEAVAGLSVSGPTDRFSNDVLQKMGLSVRHSADLITAMTGGNLPVEE